MLKIRLESTLWLSSWLVLSCRLLMGQSSSPLQAVNAFSDDNRLAPGCLASISGNGLPSTAAGVSVGGELALVFQASSTQWLIQIPSDLAPGPTTIQIGAAPAISATLTQYAPALESADLTGTGMIAALHGQPTPVLVSPSSTAKPGEFLEVYATGLGPSNADGSVSGTVTITIAGTQVPVITSTLSTSVPGVYAVDVQLPASLPSGNDPVVLSIAGLASNKLTLPVSAASSQLGAQSPLSRVAGLSIPDNVRAVAVNGQYAYACASASIAVVDFSSLSQPAIVATFAQADLVNADYMTCDVVQNRLFVTADTSGSNAQGTTGQLLIYDLTNPVNPQRITSFATGKRFIFGQVLSGNTLFLPTVSVWSNGSYNGDLVAEDISNISQPARISTLFQGSPGWNTTYGGSQPISAAVPMAQPFIVASSTTATSWPTSASDTGTLFSVDISNPKQMSIVSTLNVPGSKIMETVVRDGNVVLGVGDTAEWEYPSIAPQSSVLVLADYTDPRNPVLLSNQITPFTTVGVGTLFGAMALGQGQFVVAGQSFNGPACLLAVNATNPGAPVLTPVYVPYPVIGLAWSGSILVTAEQTNGLGFYQLNAQAPATTVSAASGMAPVAPGSIVSIYGSNLATTGTSATTVPLPTNLGGTSVTITDGSGATAALGLFYAGPNQINAEVPETASTGTATLTITTPSGTQTASVMLAAVAPGLFTANQSGKGVAAAQLVTNQSNGQQTTVDIFNAPCAAGACVGIPLDVSSGNTALVLFGTGIQNRASLSDVTVMIGGQALPGFYAGPAPMFTGLDQVNVLLPASLAGSGTVNITVSISGTQSNVVTATFQ